MLAEETGATSAAYGVPYPRGVYPKVLRRYAKLLLENLKLLEPSGSAMEVLLCD